MSSIAIIFAIHEPRIVFALTRRSRVRSFFSHSSGMGFARWCQIQEKKESRSCSSHRFQSVCSSKQNTVHKWTAHSTLHCVIGKIKGKCCDKRWMSLLKLMVAAAALVVVAVSTIFRCLNICMRLWNLNSYLPGSVECLMSRMPTSKYNETFIEFVKFYVMSSYTHRTHTGHPPAIEWQWF